MARLRRAAGLIAESFREHDLLMYASAIAFRAFVSLIPIALLGIALLGATGREDIWEKQLSPPIEERVTAPTFKAIDAAVEQIFRQGSMALIVFAGALALWDISSAVRAAIKALDRIFGGQEDRPGWRLFAESLGLGAVTLVCLAGGGVVIPAGARVGGGALHVLFGVGRWFVAAALIGLAIGLIVRYGPAERRSRRWVTAGTLLVIVAWLGASTLFRWFAASVANYKSAAGNLTVFLLLTTYVYVSSIIFLVGVQLDELLRQSAEGEDPRLRDLLPLGR